MHSAGDLAFGNELPPRRAGALAAAGAVATVLLGTIGGFALGAEGRIQDIRDRGHLTCGVLPGVAGFAERDEQGAWSGFEIDFCRAIAAAILADPKRVQFVVLHTVDQFIAQPDVDVVSRRLTWTLHRESENDLLFGPVIFHDAAGFLVPSSSGMQRAAELAGRRLCVRTGSEANRALVDWFSAGSLELAEVPLTSLAAAAEAFFAGDCDGLVADVSELAAERAQQPEGRNDYVILPERISKEPLSLLVRQGDDDFFLVVRWTVFGLIAAEEEGIGRGNVETGTAAESRWPGGRMDLGTGLGLERDWLLNVIRAVGNYGEVYDRHLGPDGLSLPRGMNQLWTKGGLMYAPPLY